MNEVIAIVATGSAILLAFLLGRFARRTPQQQLSFDAHAADLHEQIRGATATIQRTTESALTGLLQQHNASLFAELRSNATSIQKNIEGVVTAISLGITRNSNIVFNPPTPAPNPDPSATFIPAFDAGLCGRWDREWILYLTTENMYTHLARSTDLSIVDTPSGKTPSEMFNLRLASNHQLGFDVPLRIWCPGDAIVGSNVLEMGSGCGIVPKQIAPFCNRYLGLDYSTLALTIARATTPEHCLFHHACDWNALAAEAGRYDVMIAREFFIHQNAEGARSILRLARYLLKPNGVIYADFFHRTGKAGIVYNANDCVDTGNASAGFHFTGNDVGALAQECGFEIESQQVEESEQRRFVALRARTFA